MISTSARSRRPVPREVSRAVSAPAPPRVLLVGGAGSGKTDVLAAIRAVLDAHPGARVIDDAHTLPAEELYALAVAASESGPGLIVATEPRPHLPEMRSLTTSFATHGIAVDLHSWSAPETAGRAAALGIPVRTDQIRALHRLTGGVPELVDVALVAVRSGSDVRRAVADRVRERLLPDLDLAATLALVDLGAGIDPGELATLLDVAPDRAYELVDASHASGLLDARQNILIPGASGVPAAVLGTHAVHAFGRRLLASRTDAGSLDAGIARRLADTGLSDPALAAHLVHLADSEGPENAVALFDAAVRAGADRSELALRRADIAYVTGDLGTAQHLADHVLEHADAFGDDDVRAATRISASVAAARGMLDRSADLFEWLGPERAGVDAPIAATVLLAAGRPEAATRLRTATVSGAPTSSATAARLLADGLRESLGGDGRVAMNCLARALTARGPGDSRRATPDTAEAVTALLCLHSGELGHARTVLSRSTTSVRHRLLSAWTAVLGGDLEAAALAVEQLTPEVVHQRDLLFLHALRVGLARRRGDIGALAVEWAAAQGVVAEYSVDLFGLLPLGELWLAAIRMGRPERVAHLVVAAQDLLSALGEPPLWGAALHWYGVQAAIAADRPADLVPHARALAAAAGSTTYAAVLARAGQAWLTVLRGDADPDHIRAAAESLATVGLPWDGAKLASEAALRATDTGTATTLLQVARTVRQLRGGPYSPVRAMNEPAGPGTGNLDAAPAETTGPLSDREAQVADLVVSGLTYREVGNRLYISAKTVEHHVARIRRRLGAGSRSELLSMLRAMGHGADGHRRARSDQIGGRPACP